MSTAIKMSSVVMNTGTYLSRIGFKGVAEPSLEVLRSLHASHQLSVPFENLTVHSGGKVQLDLPLLFDKIVNQRRGGFCYENNGLFSWLLGELGFQVTLISGQVKSSFTGRFGPPLDHMIIMVALEGRRWLCDVGFGGAGFSTPLLLDTEEPQQQGHRMYRIRKTPEMYFLEWQGDETTDGDWLMIYKFTLEPRRHGDFTEMCQYHQSSPYSLFFCKSLCTVPKPGGQLTYIGHKLIRKTFPTEGKGLQENTRSDLTDQEVTVILAEQFGIVLSSPLITKDEAVIPPPVTD